jgi:hypothetical protein
MVEQDTFSYKDALTICRADVLKRYIRTPANAKVEAEGHDPGHITLYRHQAREDQ